MAGKKVSKMINVVMSACNVKVQLNQSPMLNVDRLKVGTVLAGPTIHESTWSTATHCCPITGQVGVARHLN